MLGSGLGLRRYVAMTKYLHLQPVFRDENLASQIFKAVDWQSESDTCYL